MKIYLLIPFLFLSALFCPTCAFSQQDTSETLPSEHHETHALQNDPYHHEESTAWLHHDEHESDNFQAKFFNMLFILGLLIGFMMLASWALKKMMKTKLTQQNIASSIKILETRYLSPRATLYLIEVQDETFLIAESPTTMSYLTKISLKETKEEHTKD